MMNDPAWNLCELSVEVVLGGLHLHVLQLEAESHQRVVGGVIDDQRAARAVNSTGAFTSAEIIVIGFSKHRFVGDGHQLHVAHVLHGPACVVVRSRIRDRIVLHAEVHVGQRVIRLIGADDVIAFGNIEPAGFERGDGFVNFQALVAEFVDYVRCFATRRCPAGITQA